VWLINALACRRVGSKHRESATPLKFGVIRSVYFPSQNYSVELGLGRVGVMVSCRSGVSVNLINYAR